VTIQARNGAALVGSVAAMVRIRKNANALTAVERNRFVAAFAQLNNQGLGRFADFRNMHTNVSSPQAHGAPGFLPWHRAYLLDLERELQAIDQASRCHTGASIGRRRTSSRRISSAPPISSAPSASAPPTVAVLEDRRRAGDQPPALFSTSAAPPGLRNETQTLGLGTQYPAFRTLEGNPHGTAHTSFGGSISSIGTAAKDPLPFGWVPARRPQWRRRHGAAGAVGDVGRR